MKTECYKCEMCGFIDTTDIAENIYFCHHCDKDMCTSCAKYHALNEIFDRSIGD